MTSNTVVVNGVFEGGGVKGLMYIGALEACEHADVEFAAVAGSSAGAITAMLVACGYSASELEHKIPEAFAALGSPRRAFAAVSRKSLLNSDSLRRWLGESIAHKLNENSGTNDYDGSATFCDIRAVTNITLYVVCVDLESRQPIVFSPDLTPDMTVADAVVASSSIPVAFPAQRISVGGQARKVVDGGVWANYPSFVFCDSHFRSYHRAQLNDGAESRRTLGFILDEVEGAPVIAPGAPVAALSPKPSPTDGGSVERSLGALGSLLASPVVRAFAMVLPLLFLVISMSWFDREIDANLPLIEHLPNGFEDAALIVLIVLFAALIVQSVLFAAVMLRLGGSVSDEGLVGASAALGVSSSVPYWVGFIQDPEALGHVAIRLPVPPRLKTLSNGLDDELSRHAIAVGFQTTMVVLIRNLIGVAGEPPPPVPPPPTRQPTAIHPLSVITFWAIAPISFMLLALEAIKAIAEGDDPWWTLPGLIAFALVMFAFHAISRSRLARARGSWFSRLPRTALLISAGVATLFGITLIASQLNEAASRELSIRERIGAETLAATVIGIADSSNQPVTQVQLVGGVLPDYADAEFGELVPYHDLNSTEIGQCGVGCLAFPRIAQVTEGSMVDVRFDANDGVAFLHDDRWETTGVDALLFLLAAALLGLGIRSWGAYRSHPDLDASPASPSASPSMLSPPPPRTPPPPVTQLPPGSVTDQVDLRDPPDRVIRF